jgi:hypothetical protein
MAQLTVGQPNVSHQHWARRFGSLFNLACSVIFAIGGGLSIGWLFSTLNFLGVYQPVLTVLMAVGFTLFGFFQSRDLASRIYSKEPLGFSLCGVILYEFVEMSACLFEAAHAVSKMVWLSDFNGMAHNIFYVLLLVVLAVLPAFSIFCGQMDVRLHHQKHGHGALVAQPPAVGVAPLPLSAPQQRPPLVSPAANQLKPASPTNPYGMPPVQGVPVYQSPAANQLRPGPLPVAPLPRSNETRALPESNLSYQQPAQGLPGVTTDSLGSSSRPFQPSDDETLITQSQVPDQSKGGGWRSKVPLLGRRLKEVEPEYPEVLV